jgi:membrane fusion protein (multidrug efflux system)
MKVSSILALLLALTSLSLPACDASKAEEPTGEHHKIVLTSPLVKDVVLTQPYVCQIHSRRHIKVRALEDGYLEEIKIKEGQAVTKGQELFKVVPILYKTKLQAELAEVALAQQEYNNNERLAQDKVISPNELALYKAKLEKAKAKANQAQAELNFCSVKASFDGIVDRLHEQQGSLVKKDDTLTTLSDNSIMWVYFNVPEVRYYEYKARQGKTKDTSRLKLVDSRVDLVLADGKKFDQSAGDTVTVEGKFNNETGNIAFRADFPNPDRLLRHGQTGTVLISRRVHGAVVIPQRATYEILDKQYVYVVDKDNVAHQRLITVDHELDDVFVIGKGLGVNDRIVLEGVRQVHDGEKVGECEFRDPEEALKNMKYHAE